MRLLAALLGVLAAGCAPAATTGRAGGEQPTIVSLNPCTDAVLAEVAAPGQLLAISHYSHDPASSSMDLDVAHRFAATGGTVEEVLALDPDVVVAGSFLPPATSAAFARLGIEVRTFGIASDVSASRAQVRELALLAGDEAAGDALIARIDAALASARSDGAPVPALVWQSGGLVPGEATLIADLLRSTGFANFAASRGLGQADRLPLEEVLADPPRVILAAGGDMRGEDRMLAHPALAELRDTRVERFDPSLLYCGGPTIIRAAERLAAIRSALPVTDRLNEEAAR